MSMHRHPFEPSSRWPNEFLCQHVCEEVTSQSGRCTAPAHDPAHAVRGSRYVPGGFYLLRDVDSFAGRLQRNPHVGRELDEPQPAADRFAPLSSPDEPIDAAIGELIKCDLLDSTLAADEASFELICENGEEPKSFYQLAPGVSLAQLNRAARLHWNEYHSAKRH